MSSNAQEHQPQSSSWLSPINALFSRLQNLFAITVWPDQQDNTLNIPDDEENDLLLFGNKRAAEPIKSVPVSALDATLGSVVPRDVRSTADNEGPRFLDTYSEADLRGFFSSFRFETGRYVGKNFYEMFEQLGFTHLIFSIDVSDHFVHRVSLYDTKECPGNLLAQLFIRRETTFSVLNTKKFDPKAAGVPQYYAHGFDEGLAYLHQYFCGTDGKIGSSDGNHTGQTSSAWFGKGKLDENPHLLQMIAIEWLRFQNPKKAWGNMIPLPGQFHPGLGSVDDMQTLLQQLCEKRNRDGVLNIPEHWHNAYVYSRMRWSYHFLNPAFEGFFLSTRTALEKDIKERGLAMVAWAVKLGLLRCRVPPELLAEGDDATTTCVIRWVGQEQVTSSKQKLIKYFESPKYKELVKKYTRPDLFYIDWSAAALLPVSSNVPFDIKAFASPTPSSSPSSSPSKETTVTTATTTTTTSDQEPSSTTTVASQ